MHLAIWYLILGSMLVLTACGESPGKDSEEDSTTTETLTEDQIYDEDAIETPSNDRERNIEEVFDISGTKADKVSIMMPLNSVRETYPEEQILDISHLAGEEVVKLRIFDEEQFPLMEVDFDCSMTDCPAVSIAVIDDRFRTQYGVGVGSTWGEINAIFPTEEIEVWEDALGTVFLEPSEQPHVFVMDLAGVPDSFAIVGLEALPQDLPVVEVLIY